MAGVPSRGRRSRSEIHAQLAVAVEELQSQLGALPSPLEAQEIWGEIWSQEAHNSTAIEGNTLLISEVELLLREGRAVGDKQLAEYLEVQGYADAARWVYERGVDPSEWESGELVTLAEVRNVHRLALAKAWGQTAHSAASADEGPGAFRRHGIEPFPGGMKPPDWTEVPALMADWVERACRLRASTLPPLQAIAELHAELERIHPFLDGNGRSGRLVMNLLLIRLGYPPAIIRKGERARYLTRLRSADRGDAGPLGELLARAVTDTLYRFIVPAVAGPKRLVPFAALADQRASERALRTAAERGRLRALHDGRGQWRSTRSWADAYLESRHRRASDPVAAPGFSRTD